MNRGLLEYSQALQNDTVERPGRRLAGVVYQPPFYEVKMDNIVEPDKRVVDDEVLANGERQCILFPLTFASSLAFFPKQFRLRSTLATDLPHHPIYLILGFDLKFNRSTTVATNQTTMASTAFCASGPNLQSRNYGSNLLSIPTELRGMLYSYFLKHSTNFDVPDGSVIAKIDLSLLQICRQMRNEALKYLLGTNSWTRLTADYNQVDLSIALKALLHLDINLFAGKEREQIVSNAVLHVHIGDSLPYKYYATTRACDDYLVAYSVAFRVRLPKILISPSYRYSFERVISININLTDRKQGEAENLLLSLANIRGWFGVSDIEVIGAQPSTLIVAVRDAMAGQNTQFEHFHESTLR